MGTDEKFFTFTNKRVVIVCPSNGFTRQLLYYIEQNLFLKKSLSTKNLKKKGGIIELIILHFNVYTSFGGGKW